MAFNPLNEAGIWVDFFVKELIRNHPKTGGTFSDDHY